MTEREKALRAGYVETVRYDFGNSVFLYWEPHTDGGRVKHSFTMDHGSLRERWPTFEAAVQRLEEYTLGLDIKAALKALGIKEGEDE
jgi:hypothetical protein